MYIACAATSTPRWPSIFGVVFILIVLFFPYGIVGTWRSRVFAQEASGNGLWRFSA
jgi:ABC-type branched-subunit amino acid transport system permease subunit